MINQLETISIVLPCHNEQEVIFNSWSELSVILKSIVDVTISDYELIMVNNGSTDETLKIMLEIQKKDSKVKVVDLRNNFGYQGSITAGLSYASNDMIVTIDADLQDDPLKIKEMIQKYYDGFELVLGVRSSRKTDSYLKRNTANIYYRLSKLLGIKTIPHHGDFRLMSRKLLIDFNRYKESNRYIRGLILTLENKYALVEYSRRKRLAGSTKFKPIKMLELALDGITSFSTTPIKFITLLGFFMFLLSLASILFISYQKFFSGTEVPGWTFIALTVSLFGGLNSLFIGIIGEYIGKSYVEVKNRPVFITRKTYGFPKHDGN